jgi:hypothetical protein
MVLLGDNVLVWFLPGRRTPGSGSKECRRHPELPVAGKFGRGATKQAQYATLLCLYCLCLFQFLLYVIRKYKPNMPALRSGEFN